MAAITYHVVSLIGYLLEALGGLGVHLTVHLLQGLSVPLVALLVWWGACTVREKPEVEQG